MRPPIDVQRLVPQMQSFVPPSLQHDPALKTRTENLIAAAFLTGIVALGFGSFYLWLDHPAAAASCFTAAAIALISLAVLKMTGRLALTRNMLILTIFALLLVLTYFLNGVSAPTSFWLAACPLVATVTGGRRAGLNWALIALLGVGLIFVSDALGLIPPSTFTNLWLIEVVSISSFVLIVAVFVLMFERITATTIDKLDEAISVINELAIRDELTGVFNRREIIRLAEQERDRAERQAVPFCLCLIDLDHFKEVNDSCGHAAGDLVLKGVARRIQEEIRRIDCFGRYGGEEFLLLLVATDAAMGKSMADRLRECVEHFPLPPELQRRRATISVGVAEHAWPETIEQTISRADSALYEAKRTGRNRVVVARSPVRGGTREFG